MPAAIAIPLVTAAVGTGATVYGAHRASNAAREAGETQSDAANRAAEMQLQASREGLGFAREEAAFNRQAQAPYRAIGTGAINTLSNLTGVPMVYDTPPAGASSQMDTRANQGMSSSGNTLATMAPPIAGFAHRNDPTDAEQTALLRSPSGAMRRVPINQAAHYLQRGAVRVG